VHDQKISHGVFTQPQVTADLGVPRLLPNNLATEQGRLYSASCLSGSDMLKDNNRPLSDVPALILLGYPATLQNEHGRTVQ